MEKIRIHLEKGPLFEKMENACGEIERLAYGLSKLGSQLLQLERALKEVGFNIVLPLNTEAANSACDTIGGDESILTE